MQRDQENSLKNLLYKKNLFLYLPLLMPFFKILIEIIISYLLDKHTNNF